MTVPETLEGWFALHDLRRLDRKRWGGLDETQRKEAIAETGELLDRLERRNGGAEGRSVTYAIVGHKADLLMLHLRPEVGDLADSEEQFTRTTMGSCMDQTWSYLSVTEVSRHGAPEGTAENIEKSPYIQSRLYPEIPAISAYICFYPMSKRRLADDNWYRLDDDARGDLMRAHGKTGRAYAGKVSQIVTGSTGLDDWEWGVTLFADDPLQFKKLVYEMRFDEVTARYGEFGPFVVGRRLVPDRLEEYFDV